MNPIEDKITREEMVTLFGDEIPIEAVQLVWGCPGDWTIGKLRAEVRRIANERHKP